MEGSCKLQRWTNHGSPGECPESERREGKRETASGGHDLLCKGRLCLSAICFMKEAVEQPCVSERPSVRETACVRSLYLREMSRVNIQVLAHFSPCK